MIFQKTCTRSDLQVLVSCPDIVEARGGTTVVSIEDTDVLYSFSLCCCSQYVPSHLHSFWSHCIFYMKIDGFFCTITLTQIKWYIPSHVRALWTLIVSPWGGLPLKLCSVFTTFCEFVAGEQRHFWSHIWWTWECMADQLKLDFFCCRNLQGNPDSIMSWKKFQIGCQEDTFAWWQTEHNNTPLEVSSTCGGGCNGTMDWEEGQGFFFQEQGMIPA